MNSSLFGAGVNRVYVRLDNEPVLTGQRAIVGHNTTFKLHTLNFIQLCQEQPYLRATCSLCEFFKLVEYSDIITYLGSNMHHGCP